MLYTYYRSYLIYTLLVREASHQALNVLCTSPQKAAGYARITRAWR
jgi:hypothetical protein